MLTTYRYCRYGTCVGVAGMEYVQAGAAQTVLQTRARDFDLAVPEHHSRSEPPERTGEPVEGGLAGGILDELEDEEEDVEQARHGTHRDPEHTRRRLDKLRPRHVLDVRKLPDLGP
eukprot:1948932-Rhodomonas_salina.2